MKKDSSFKCSRKFFFVARQMLAFHEEMYAVCFDAVEERRFVFDNVAERRPAPFQKQRRFTSMLKKGRFLSNKKCDHIF